MDKKDTLPATIKSDCDPNETSELGFTGAEHLTVNQAHTCISRILDSLDALVYVADMETYEILYFNHFGRDEWGLPGSQKCFQVLQRGQAKPCGFCTNDKLVDSDGNPTGVHVWEFQNTVSKRWYQCRDQAIPWVDGRLVRLEIATDITERKNTELALRRAKDMAERRANTDELTNLNNRHSFFNRGSHAIKQAVRSQHHLSILMLDLDFFKKINDTYGHEGGDETLRAFASCLERELREVDIIGRLGGEEFAAVLYDIDQAEALRIAERIRVKVEDLNIPYKGKQITLTASFGVASMTKENNTLETLLKCADDALYQAKRGGRNRVAVI